jgi:hypothetical protein
VTAEAQAEPAVRPEVAVHQVLHQAPVEAIVACLPVHPDLSRPAVHLRFSEVAKARRADRAASGQVQVIEAARLSAIK